MPWARQPVTHRLLFERNGDLAVEPFDDGARRSCRSKDTDPEI
jgi:hypothetical protein